MGYSLVQPIAIEDVNAYLWGGQVLEMLAAHAFEADGGGAKGGHVSLPSAISRCLSWVWLS